MRGLFALNVQGEKVPVVFVNLENVDHVHETEANGLGTAIVVMRSGKRWACTTPAPELVAAMKAEALTW